MSIDRGIYKEDVVHIYNGILLNHKKEWNSAICSNMDGSRDCHSEWSKSDRERQISHDITHMWNLILKRYKWTYLQNRIRLTNIENKLMVTKGETWGGRNKSGAWENACIWCSSLNTISPETWRNSSTRMKCMKMHHKL